MRSARKPRAFTLLELLIVVVIIGIILALILRASMDGIRRAEERATQALITKLETGLADRIDSLTQQRPPRTGVHDIMASVFITTPPSYTPANFIAGDQRGQVIAQFDYMRAEVPDVFVYDRQNFNSDPQSPGHYPLNFAAHFNRFAPTLGDAYTLPLGASNSTTYPNATWGLIPPGAVPTGTQTVFNGSTVDAYYVPVTGMYGASFAAAAGIYKNLGYGPKGLDGQDNDGDGFVDDFHEGCMNLSASDQAQILARLQNHTHKTARAEMLYAVLVEGRGPLGSTFDADEFTDKEVRDTDGDGLPEFVDAWGEPLQFFRWPILYRSDLQKGYPDYAKISADLASGHTEPGPYAGVFETREQNPLDPNQLLMGPAWWVRRGQAGGIGINYGPPGITGTGIPSNSVFAFQEHFHALYEPIAEMKGATPNQFLFWDRSVGANSMSSRRAYYSKFLILSAGPDKLPGVAQLGVNYQALDERSRFPVPNKADVSTRDKSGAMVPLDVDHLIQVENQGAKIDPNRTGPPYYAPVYPAGGYRNDTNSFLEECSGDDITNHNITAPGGAIQ